MSKIEKNGLQGEVRGELPKKGGDAPYQADCGEIVGNAELSPLVRELSWSNNLLIMTGAKSRN